MKRISKWISIPVITLLLLSLSPEVAMAQGLTDPDVPIDGGLSLLLAAGVGYGVKKVRDSRKKKQEQERL